MRRSEARHGVADRLDAAHRRRSRPSSVPRPDGELLEQLLPAIARHRRDAQRRLEELARRRLAIGRSEHPAGDALRAEAVAIRSELARLDLVASVMIKLLQPSAAERGDPAVAEWSPEGATR